MPASLVCSASENSLVLALASYAVLISALVWSAVAPLSIVSNFVPSAATSLPSTVPDTVIVPPTVRLPVPAVPVVTTF